jgi:hypothetical protein
VKEKFSLQRCSGTMFVRDLFCENIMPINVPFMYSIIISINSLIALEGGGGGGGRIDHGYSSFNL